MVSPRGDYTKYGIASWRPYAKLWWSISSHPWHSFPSFHIQSSHPWHSYPGMDNVWASNKFWASNTNDVFHKPNGLIPTNSFSLNKSNSTTTHRKYSQ